MKRNQNFQKNQIKAVLNMKLKVLLKLLKKKLLKRMYLLYSLLFSFIEFSIFRFNFVAGGDGEGKGLVETVKEKATGAYVYLTYGIILIE